MKVQEEEAERHPEFSRRDRANALTPLGLRWLCRAGVLRAALGFGLASYTLDVLRSRATERDRECMDANLVGGDVGGGAMDLRQSLCRPTRRGYATSTPGV